MDKSSKHESRTIAASMMLVLFVVAVTVVLFVSIRVVLQISLCFGNG